MGTISSNSFICGIGQYVTGSDSIPLVGHSGLEPETLRLSGVRSKPAELMPVKLVGSKGLEPLCFAALDPKSSVSANSTNSPIIRRQPLTTISFFLQIRLANDIKYPLST